MYGSAGGNVIISGYNLQVQFKFGSIKMHPFLSMRRWQRVIG